MELKDFVSNVLVSVVRGVEQAQDELKNSKAIINPLGTSSAHALRTGQDTPDLTSVEFEVSVEVSNGKEGGVGLNVSVAFVDVNGGGKKSSSESQSSRLKFSVPVHLPPGMILGK